MKAMSNREAMIILCPSSMKALLPYFYRNWPENKVTTTCKRFKYTNTESTSSGLFPTTDEKATLPPKLPRAAPPDS